MYASMCMPDGVFARLHLAEGPWWGATRALTQECDSLVVTTKMNITCPTHRLTHSPSTPPSSLSLISLPWHVSHGNRMTCPPLTYPRPTHTPSLPLILFLIHHLPLSLAHILPLTHQRHTHPTPTTPTPPPTHSLSSGLTHSHTLSLTCSRYRARNTAMFSTVRSPGGESLEVFRPPGRGIATTNLSSPPGACMAAMASVYMLRPKQRINQNGHLTHTPSIPRHRHFNQSTKNPTKQSTS